jgi:thioredoxin reductase
MEQVDVLIIGAGPGGLQVALTLGEIQKRNGVPFSYLVADRASSPGSFFERYPVHGRLISNNKLYSGEDPRGRFSERFDWNSLITDDRAVLARDYSREFYPRRELVPQMLAALCERHGLPVVYDFEIDSLCCRDGLFIAASGDRALAARFLVVATGLKPAKVSIPGIDLATPYAEMKAKEHYRDRRTLIIGKGNSGMECGLDIVNEASVIMLASPSPARLAFRTHYVGSIRMTNAMLIENYQLKSQAALLDCQILEIRRDGNEFAVDVAYMHADGERETLNFDEIIAATGFTGQLDLLDEAFPIRRLHGKFPDLDGNFESRDVPGLYFAGALTHGRDYRSHSSSGFIHGFRYNSMILARHLAERLGVREAPPVVAADRIVEHLLDDLENDAGIYLQPGYVGLCYERAADGNWLALGYRTCHRFESETPDPRELRMLVALEYSDAISTFPDPLMMQRHPGNPDESMHIHPVIRVRDGDESLCVNLEENLLNRYRRIPSVRETLERLVAVPHRTNPQTAAASAAAV